MRLRKDALDPIAVDGTTLLARISVQVHWPKNMQAYQKTGEDWKKRKGFELFRVQFGQARRHGGGHFGAVPPKWLLVLPKWKLCSPSEDCAPKKLTGSGLLECKSRPKLVFGSGIFVIFVDWHWISWHFWDEALFFLKITCFRPEKLFEFLISAGKSLWIFGLHLVHLIQTGINFSCPRAPLEFT